ncbi:MAG: 30S ribosomal protein S12 methylthiotransferase RimO [Tannerella sp.]|jgi:ribosomal protein S12 methylthiotransferase|nr:30S ribosomal protein S12 methylthiotransferase RimO [Tannerella sp.]
MRKNKVDIITLGCSKNLVDSELLMRQFQLNGYMVAHDSEHIDGEIVVVNTCAFIGDAREESVNMILALEEEKKKGRIGMLFVIGCLSQRFFRELKRELPQVDRFYGKFDWKNLLGDIGKTYFPEHAADRMQTTPPHYTYIKISEGCNRSCAFCTIPLITGKYRSRSMEDIVSEVRYLSGKGVKEFQLVAQDLTYYGLDLVFPPSLKKKEKGGLLPELVERISDIQGVEWIRLHYGYPADFPYDLLRVMRERDNVCRYLDIAFQHISDPILKRMRRKTTHRETCELIERIRLEVPGIHLRTTLMVGYPGETDRDFDELIRFVNDIRFERMGAFAYSHESGTFAYKHHKDDIPDEIKHERLDYLMRVQEKISMESNIKKIGKFFRTIIDREETGHYIGRTEFDSPEIDPEVLLTKEIQLTPGEFYDVEIQAAETFDLFGKALF